MLEIYQGSLNYLFDDSGQNVSGRRHILRHLGVPET